jgi:hypothetical protein
LSSTHSPKGRAKPFPPYFPFNPHFLHQSLFPIFPYLKMQRKTAMNTPANVPIPIHFFKNCQQLYSRPFYSRRRIPKKAKFFGNVFMQISFLLNLLLNFNALSFPSVLFPFKWNKKVQRQQNKIDGKICAPNFQNWKDE